ncbi:hypothetical protein [Litchfieldella rifensis]|uniref:Uncharacterized protein n=1 Tax=Litchfieldella rifensis TaxID=762643 RepID=A0ABV7LUL2_9GAMM
MATDVSEARITLRSHIVATISRDDVGIDRFACSDAVTLRPFKDDAKDYANGQSTFRSGTGVVINLTPDQEYQLEQCYARGQGSYSSFKNNCGDPHKRCLEEVLGESISNSFFPVSIGNDLLESPFYGGSTFYPGPQREFGADAPWAR